MRLPSPFLALMALFTTAVGAEESKGDITVMTFNCWYDLTQVHNGLDKAVSAIRQSKADIIGLQESSPDTADKLAEQLGFHRATSGEGSCQIISRFPIVEGIPVGGMDVKRTVAAKIRISGTKDREVVFYNIHLDAGAYGPYAAHKPDASSESVAEEEAKSARTRQITGVLKSMRPHLERCETTPVILAGDFNSPSPQDWVGKNQSIHGGIEKFDWPAIALPSAAGLIDSFRKIHPDPVAKPGITWSTIHKESEPQDRIDYIFHKGKSLRPVASTVFATDIQVTVGGWGCDIAPVADNTWPSDHFAVVTIYQFMD